MVFMRMLKNWKKKIINSVVDDGSQQEYFSVSVESSIDRRFPH